jgi:ornithine cyclodeaminase/alanine dehydrogenase-like protein (mu-crystallin family)
MLYLTESEVHQLLPMRTCIDLLRRAFEEQREGMAHNQIRRRLVLPTGTVLHALAGATSKYLATKVYSTNGKQGTFEFFVILYQAETGEALAIMRGEELGAIRTGAASGYAADLLAPPEANVLGMIGTGFQARTQLEAIRAVRPIQEVRVWSRNRDRVEKFAKENNAIPAESAEAAIRGAQIVVTATNAKDPVLDASWIEPGTFIAAMGANQGNRRELPTELVTRAGLIAIDSVDQGKIEAGDQILADTWKNVVELKDVQRGYDASRITIFESLGIGLEDTAAAGYVYEEAVKRGIGTQLPE